MQIQVNTSNHIEGSESLNRYVERVVGDALERYNPQITRVEVHIDDENSLKPGENDKRCMIEARLSGLKPIAVNAKAANVQQALDSAIDKILSALDTHLGRIEDRSGRPQPGFDQIA